MWRTFEKYPESLKTLFNLESSFILVSLIDFEKEWSGRNGEKFISVDTVTGVKKVPLSSIG